MIEREDGIIRTVAWSEVFPWLKIVRAFQPAMSVKSLILGAAGALAMSIGWSVICSVFAACSPATEWQKPFFACPWMAVTNSVPDRPGIFAADSGLPNPEKCTGNLCVGPHWTPYDAIVSPWMLLTSPARYGMSYTNLSPTVVANLLLCGLWGIAVWAFFGAAVCRTAAVQLTVDEQIGVGSALRFALRKWPAYFAAPLFLVAGVLLAALPVLILGWIMRAGVGLLLCGIVWPLALVAGAVMVFFLIDILFGWPLMWATISTEGTDCFDALSRPYAYTFQRPLLYLFYAVVAAAFGFLGWVLVANIAAGVIWLAYWATGWGIGAENLSAIMAGGDTLTGSAWLGAKFIQFWTGCVQLLATGFVFSYFWSASAAVYLLLRCDVDATEMDEVYLDSDESEEKFSLPPIVTDPAGAPAVKDEADVNDTAE